MNFGSDLTTIIAAGAILGGAVGIIAKFWGTLKVIYNKCFSMIVSTICLEEGNIRIAVLSWMLKNLKRSVTQERTFGGATEYLKSGKYGMVGYERFDNNVMIFWKGWLPLIHVIKNLENNKQSVKIYFIRGTFKFKDIISEAVNDRNSLSWDIEDKNKPKRFFIKSFPESKQDKKISKDSGGVLKWYDLGIFELTNFEKDQLGKQEDGFCNLNNLVFSPQVQEILTEAIQWKQSKEWYNEKKIPWKRGWLLYGIPGCGKTAIVRAIAQHLDMPLYVFSLGELENEDFKKSWEEMQSNVPCVALFEDFDNVFHGRVNVYNKPQLSDLIPGNSLQQPQSNSALKSGRLAFDCFLNCLDGVDKNEGIFTVITTNHVEHIDPAIGAPSKDAQGKIIFTSTRPGRIDRAIELGYMRNQEKLILAEGILNDCPDGLLEIKKFIRENPDVNHTPAQWQEKCSQIALKEYWAKKNISEIKIIKEEAA